MSLIDNIYERKARLRIESSESTHAPRFRRGHQMPMDTGSEGSAFSTEKVAFGPAHHPPFLWTLVRSPDEEADVPGSGVRGSSDLISGSGLF